MSFQNTTSLLCPVENHHRSRLASESLTEKQHAPCERGASASLVLVCGVPTHEIDLRRPLLLPTPTDGSERQGLNTPMLPCFQRVTLASVPKEPSLQKTSQLHGALAICDVQTKLKHPAFDWNIAAFRLHHPARKRCSLLRSSSSGNACGLVIHRQPQKPKNRISQNTFSQQQGSTRPKHTQQVKKQDKVACHMSHARSRDNSL